MLRTWRKPQKLFTDFNTLQFASVTGVVVFVLLLIFMVVPTAHPSSSVDLPKVARPVLMRGVMREDAIVVSVTRDGRVWLGTDPIYFDDLSVKIRHKLLDHSVERKVYIRADMRAKWGAVKQALDAIRSAGILRVAFLADQRRS